MKDVEKLPREDSGSSQSCAGSANYIKKMYERTSQMGRIGVWECDLASEELSWTDMVYDLFGFPRQSRVSRAATLACYEPQSRREMEELRAQAIANCSNFTVDTAIRTQQGELRWIRITGDVEQQDGKPVRIFGTKQDITREKTAQLELQELQAKLVHLSHQSAVNAMGSTLAHELNQPLAAIIAYAAALQNKLAREKDAHDDEFQILEGIQSCSLKAGVILRELYKSCNPPTQDNEMFDLENEVRLACAIALPGDQEEPLVNYAFCEGLCASGDPVQFRQVVINLIRNARDAMTNSSKREILISTAQADGFAEVTVCDTGSGIPDEVTDSLFNAFVSTKAGSTGLGLAISRTIVEAFAGKLTAANDIGGGAKFRFTVPVAQPRDYSGYRVGQ
ncbi:MAG: sensor histidine kinase [Erythrobacter sp.]|nr:MAG: sensor histidine kinase [Erythrobacter sp.]